MSRSPVSLTTPQARPVISKRNLFREVYFSLRQHHRRVIATVASAAIGIFGLVAGIGITRTRDAQTLNRFDALAATQLTARVQQSNPASYPVTLPPNAQDRLENINGIVSAGTYATISLDSSASTSSFGTRTLNQSQLRRAEGEPARRSLSTPVNPTGKAIGPESRVAAEPSARGSNASNLDLIAANALNLNFDLNLNFKPNPNLDPNLEEVPSTFLVRATLRETDASAQTFPAILRAASPGLFPTIQVAFTTGRPFTAGNNTNRDHVAVIGSRVANQLGITSLANRPSVYIGNEYFEVLGIVGENVTKPELVNAVILPTLTAQQIYTMTDPSIEIRTSINATNLSADVLTQQIQLALANANPEAIQVTQPSGLTNIVRDQISGDLNTGFTFLAALLITLTIATISISTSSAVEARRHEIGLRRALGAARKHIRRQIILEAAFTGGIAAIIGTLTGLLATLYWAQRSQWNVVQDRITIPAALIAGPLLGILGGIWPAWKASRQQPADTLRSL